MFFCFWSACVTWNIVCDPLPHCHKHAQCFCSRLPKLDAKLMLALCSNFCSCQNCSLEHTCDHKNTNFTTFEVNTAMSLSTLFFVSVLSTECMCVLDLEWWDFLITSSWDLLMTYKAKCFTGLYKKSTPTLGSHTQPDIDICKNVHLHQDYLSGFIVLTPTKTFPKLLMWNTLWFRMVVLRNLSFLNEISAQKSMQIFFFIKEIDDHIWEIPKLMTLHQIRLGLSSLWFIRQLYFICLI